MSMMIRFAPWLAFLVVTSATDWRLGLAAGLVAQIVTIAARKPRRVGVLDAGMLVFFAGVGVYAVLRPESGLQHHLGAVSMLWLAVVAAASVLLGHPFTLDVSARDVSPQVAASTTFRDINRTIAWAWAVCFAGIAAVQFATAAVDAPGWGLATTAVLLVAAIRFTKHYPDRAVAARQQRSAPVGIG